MLKENDLVTIHLMLGNSINGVIRNLPTKEFPFWNFQKITYYMDNTWKLKEETWICLQQFQYMEKLDGNILHTFIGKQKS